jgi:hypothetical protein
VVAAAASTTNNPSPRVVMPAAAKRSNGEEVAGSVAGMFRSPADARVPTPFKLKGVLVAHLQVSAERSFGRTGRPGTVEPAGA